jgi:hypothetical protein
MKRDKNYYNILKDLIIVTEILKNYTAGRAGRRQAGSGY